MSWKKITFFNFMIVFIILVLLEITISIIFYTKKGELLYGKPRNDVIFSNVHLSKHYRPNFILKLKHYENFPGDLYVNEYGLIDTVNKKGDDYPTLLMIGSSTMEGRGSTSNNTTIASYVSKCLSDNGKPHMVHNLGRSGLYSYTENRLLTETFLPKFKPDILVQFGGFADYSYSLMYDDEKFIPHSDVNNFKKLRKLDAHGSSFLDALIDLFYNTHIYRAISWLNKKSNLLKNGDPTFSRFVEIESKNMHMRAKNAARFLDVQIKNTSAISKFWGAKYYHFLEPKLLLEDRNFSDRELTHINNFRLMGQYNKKYIEELRYFYNYARENLLDMTTDLTNVFLDKEGETLYSDVYHYSDVGNKIIGFSICKKIISS
jgi:hypothetical protein